MGVGIILKNTEGDVLVLERRDRPGSWQFPQGGIDRGEARLAAAHRELRVETGVDVGDVVSVREFEHWLVYELPEKLRSKQTALGQVQWWFLFELLTGADLPDLADAPTEGFGAMEWVTMDEAVSRAIEFKRPIYEALRTRFAKAAAQ